MSNIPRVLIIAGSDSSGGAGVQADIKTCAAFGVYSSTAMTAITAQNTKGVDRVELVSADMVVAQIKAVLSDIGADVIKTGMLANAEIINAVADCLQDEDMALVLDPVMVATSGDRLLDKQAVCVLIEKLLPMADLLTPNIPEAEVLTGLKITNTDEMIKAGESLLELGVGAVLMKGGHLAGKTVIDILVSAEGNQIMTSPRIDSRNTHGTGCSLASGIAALLARGLDMGEAVSEAREFVHEAIKTAPGIGAGNGPLNHGLIEMGADIAEKKQLEDNPFSVLETLKDKS